MALAFVVLGPPVPWQRVAGGHVPERTRDYKALVGLHALGARSRTRGWRQDAPAYAVELDVYRVPPRGKARRGDVDNFAKGALDSLSGVLWVDDSAVLDLHARILICEPGRGRLEVRVRALEEAP